MGINLTSLSDGPYEMDSGQSVTWTVLIDILLDAVTEEDHLSVRWSIADNEIISNSTSPIKYQTVTEHNQTLWIIIEKERAEHWQFVICPATTRPSTILQSVWAIINNRSVSLLKSEVFNNLSIF